ncbi:MAG: type IV secretory system conjugative DNA transfer family protein [Clostridiales bacterium]|jgi:type IV secretion system protein VirD4|nr:type IV secretory system conjugative DNA transfer family protein [Clostridiales bacterium]
MGKLKLRWMALDKKKIILAALPLIVCGILGNWISCCAHAHFGGNYWNALVHALAGKDFSLLLQSAPLSFDSRDLLVGLGSMAVAFLATEEVKENRKKYKKGQEHGAARWGTKKDILPFIDPVFQKNVILSSSEFLTMESRPKDWTKSRNKNILIVGGSGSGKTRNFIKPNIMQMHSSFVVTDPKGTILNELGGMLAMNNYDIKVFDLVDMGQSMRYNPLAYIFEPEDILKVVEAIMANTNGDLPVQDDFWAKCERLLYMALIGAIVFELPKRRHNLGTLSDLLAMMQVKEDDEDFVRPDKGAA